MWGLFPGPASPKEVVMTQRRGDEVIEDKNPIPKEMSGNLELKPGMKTLAWIILLAVASIIVFVLVVSIARCDAYIEGFVIQPTREQEEIVTRIAMLVIGFEDNLKEPISKVVIEWKDDDPDKITWTELVMGEDGDIKVYYNIHPSPHSEHKVEKKVGI